MDDEMQLLIDKELNSDDKILKPDFNSKTGRELPFTSKQNLSKF